MPKQANIPTLFEHLRGKRTSDIRLPVELNPEEEQTLRSRVVTEASAGAVPATAAVKAGASGAALTGLRKAFDVANRKAAGL